MTPVTATPQSRLASFALRPVPTTPPTGGPPVLLTLSGSGYYGTVSVPGGYPGGSVSLPITPPPTHPVIVTACFVNQGQTPVLLDGTSETRTVARPQTQVDGQPVLGDIALAFVDSAPHRLIGRLGTVFGHMSALTDGLVPVWIIWILAIVVGFGVPLAIVIALYMALRADFEAVS